MADFRYINYLYHHGIKGQKWGIRRYQNEDGTLTEEGMERYRKDIEKMSDKEKVKNYIKDKEALERKEIPEEIKPSSEYNKKIKYYEKERQKAAKEVMDEYSKITGYKRDYFGKTADDDINTVEWILWDDGYEAIHDAKHNGKDISKIDKLLDKYDKILDEQLEHEAKRRTENLIKNYYGSKTIEDAVKSQENQDKVRKIIGSVGGLAGAAALMALIKYLGRTKK